MNSSVNTRCCDHSTVGGVCPGGEGGHKVEKGCRGTHRGIGLLDEFALPHLQTALPLLQLLFLGAQISLQLLKSLKCGFNLTPTRHSDGTM